MFARKKPARAAETSALNMDDPAPGEATTPTPEPVLETVLGAVFEAAPPLELAPKSTHEPEPAPMPAPPPAPEPAPAPVAAAPSRAPSRPVTPASRPKAVTFLGGDLTFAGTLSGDGDVHLGGAFEGDVRARDITVSSGGRVEGVLTGRRIEVHGRVKGGVVADEVRVRIKAELEGDVTTDSFSLEAGSKFEGRSVRSPR